MPRRIFITVAEVSGDQHAAQLVRSLRQIDPSIVVEAHGGPLMRQAGAVIHHETTAAAAMGISGIKRAAEVWKLLQRTGRMWDENRPDLLVCVDSPAMNFHFAKLAHARGIRVLYYIAPQLWAWREGRMRKLRKWVDHVACILPFEEEYFRRHGVPATFVGHPLFDELPAGRTFDPAEHFPNRPPVVGLLTGSRKGEALGNFRHLLDVAGQIQRVFPDVSFLAPTTPATHPVVERLAAGLPRIQIAPGQFDQMVPRCDLCLTVSGTATLHVAAHGVPMIVVYRGNPVLWHLIGRWIIKMRTYSLVNLLADCRDHIVPEFIPWYGSNQPVADMAISFLKNSDKLAAQRHRLRKLVESLDHPGASDNVARMAMQLLA